MRVIDRLAAYLDFKHISSSAFERKCRLGNGYFKKQFRGKGTIGSDILKKILHAYPEINTDWLLLGNGSMLREKQHGENPVKTPGSFYSWQDHVQSLQTRIDYLEKVVADKERIILLLENKQP